MTSQPETPAVSLPPIPDEARTAAEQVVARLDSYTQEEHVERIRAARERAEARRAARTERARTAAARLRRLAREATDTERTQP